MIRQPPRSPLFPYTTLSQSARKQQDPHVYLGPELSTNPAGGPARAAPSRFAVTLEHEDGTATSLREVVRDTGPDHTCADDDDLGGTSHTVTDRVARMFNRT